MHDADSTGLPSAEQWREQMTDNLFNTVRDGDISGYNEFVRYGDVSAVQNGESLLHVALSTPHDIGQKSGRPLIAAALLREHADKIDVNAPNREGLTPLQAAAAIDDWRTVKLLLARENIHDINLPDKDGNTALHHAAMHNAALAGTALLEAGADPSARNNAGLEPANLIDTRLERSIVEAKQKRETQWAAGMAGSPVIGQRTR